MTNYRKLTQEEFNNILDKHESYLSKAERGECADFSYVDFSNFKGSDIFENVNLTGANFTNTIISEINFIDSNLSEVKFYNAKLSSVDFKNTQLYETDFDYADLKSVSFENDRNSVFGTYCLSGISFIDSKLHNVFINYDLDYVIFDGAELKYVVFSECLIRDLEFEDAILDTVEFDGISVNKDSNEINLKNTKLINNSFKTIEELQSILRNNV